MEIKICFGFSNNYSQHFACALASILYNSNYNDKYDIYVITDYISYVNQEMIKQLKKIRKFNIKYIVIDPSEYKQLILNNNLGYSTFFRLKAFEIFDFDKILYLDTDMIIRKDLRYLWETDIEGYYCAGAEDLVASDKIKELGFDENTFYVNAGMLLLNLKYSRQNNVVQKLNDFFLKPWDSKYNDQEILNYVFQHHIKPVDITWNLTPYPNLYDDQNHYEQIKKDPAILHYIGWQKPWEVDTYPHMKSEYFKYLYMTPYYNEFVIKYDIEYKQSVLAKLNDIKDAIAGIHK